MPDGTTDPILSRGDDAETLLGVLLESVSHDLRSPQLTLTLSAELLSQAAPELDARPGVALEGLRHGAADVERMLATLATVAGARAQPEQEVVVSLPRALGRRAVRTVHGDLDSLMAAVSPLLHELLRPLFGEASAELELAVDEGELLIAGPLADDCPECDGSPLVALLGSLATHAGSPIE